ncbi:MAG: hypothetical protein E5299_01747 [Burkholderia gladioli]|nr:MAG: hypothetical protein E5299_01747 [Burkholderia gladioli]
MTQSRVGLTFVKSTLLISLSTGLVASMQGCVLAFAGAAVGGALIATDRRTLGAQTEDREIQIKAASQIKSGLPDETDVNVTVFNRHVLLTGEVLNDASKQRAEEIVRAINNVNAIVNELAVQPVATLSDHTNDSYLEGRVKTALIAEKGISANDFKVVCERGDVYLLGLVTVEEGNRGADVASRVPGVVQVVKVFQYIKQADVPGLSSASAPTRNDGVSQPASVVDVGPTVGAVPDSSVIARPLQLPVSVSVSPNVHPDNLKAGCNERRWLRDSPCCSVRRDGGATGSGGGTCRVRQYLHGLPRGRP